MSTDPDPVDTPGLVADMRPALLKYFRRRTGSAAEAEDLTQDVLLRALTPRQVAIAGSGEGLHLSHCCKPLA